MTGEEWAALKKSGRLPQLPSPWAWGPTPYSVFPGNPNLVASLEADLTLTLKITSSPPKVSYLAVPYPVQALLFQVRSQFKGAEPEVPAELDVKAISPRSGIHILYANLKGMKLVKIGSWYPDSKVGRYYGHVLEKQHYDDWDTAQQAFMKSFIKDFPAGLNV